MGAETVLVTGGSGYIGGWCVASLLQRGYVVRTTVRDLAKEPAVRTAVGKVTDPGNRLAFHVVNLMSDHGWDAAAEQRHWPADRCLIVVAEIAEALKRIDEIAIRTHGKGIEAARVQVIKLVAQDVANGAQFACVSIFLAQQPRRGVAATIGEFRKIHGDQRQLAAPDPQRPLPDERDRHENE